MSHKSLSTLSVEMRELLVLVAEGDSAHDRIRDRAKSLIEQYDRLSRVSLLSDYDLSEYRVGRPDGPGADIDEEACDDTECDVCGVKGMMYRPFVSRGSYRAFAECPECGNVEEF